MKVAINTCHGGFSLSTEAVLRYAELKSLPLYKVDGAGNITHFYTVPIEEYNKIHNECKSSNNYRASNALYFLVKDIERTDSYLIQTILELGQRADGRCANLTVVDIPDNIKFTIEEYDGKEHIAEQHRTWYGD